MQLILNPPPANWQHGSIQQNKMVATNASQSFIGNGLPLTCSIPASANLHSVHVSNLNLKEINVNNIPTTTRKCAPKLVSYGRNILKIKQMKITKSVSVIIMQYGYSMICNQGTYKQYLNHEILKIMCKPLRKKTACMHMCSQLPSLGVATSLAITFPSPSGTSLTH